jgi:hypothetical protein
LNKEVRNGSGRGSFDKSGEVVQQDRSLSDSDMVYVNKDWEHWVVMHRDEKVMAEDVRGVEQVMTGISMVFLVLVLVIN